jgi:hypothetical protein
LAYVWGFTKGIWYYFDESGKLIQEIDEDKPYKFTFDDVLQFCRKNGIKVNKGYEDTWEYPGNMTATNILRECFEGSCWWRIAYKIPNGVETDEEIIKLDGVTGKVISKERIQGQRYRYG